MKQLFLILIIVAVSVAAKAQDPGEFNIGIKAGLNFASIIGPSERSDTDTRLESGSAITRFLLAPTFRYAFTDRNGLILEAQYSQKGGNYTYAGKSYLIIDDVTSEALYFEGNRSVTLNINNGYLDIPVLFYNKLNDNVSLMAGGYVGFLLNSSGAGRLSFDAEERDFGNIEVDLQPISITLEHNYARDTIPLIPGATQPILNQNSVGAIEPFGDARAPTTTNAYYDYASKENNFYNGLDAGIILGVEYKFDTGLGIGLRGTYGLMDVSNNFYDYSKKSALDPENGDFSRILREDKDRNLVFQLYIGFEL